MFKKHLLLSGCLFIALLQGNNTPEIRSFQETMKEIRPLADSLEEILNQLEYQPRPEDVDLINKLDAASKHLHTFAEERPDINREAATGLGWLAVFSSQPGSLLLAQTYTGQKAIEEAELRDAQARIEDLENLIEQIITRIIASSMDPAINKDEALETRTNITIVQENVSSFKYFLAKLPQSQQ